MATTTTELTSALSAINTILATIGQAPVSSLDTPGLVDAVTAKAILNEITRSTLSKGWHFNKDYDYPIAPDTYGNIRLPSNILEIDTTREFYKYNVVRRGQKLWDKERKSFVFDKTLKFNITWLFDFEDIPEVARYYIAIKAARKFQDRSLSSDIVHGYTEADELEAWSDLMRLENEIADPSIFDDHDSHEIAFRRGY